MHPEKNQPPGSCVLFYRSTLSKRQGKAKSSKLRKYTLGQVSLLVPVQKGTRGVAKIWNKTNEREKKSNISSFNTRSEKLVAAKAAAAPSR